jgi:molecular chaperone GrpE (heat shock protein)
MLGGFDFSAPAPAADTPAADSFGKEEAAALLARIQELEAELDEKMAAEDYDRCEEINAEVEKLKEREEEAKALVSGRTGQDDDGDE